MRAEHENISIFLINLYVFLLELNFQRNKTNEALVQSITNTIVTEPFQQICNETTFKDSRNFLKL